MSNTFGLFAINPNTFNSGETFYTPSLSAATTTLISTWPKEQRDPAITAFRVVQISLNILGYMTLHPLIPAFAGACRCLGGFVTLYTAYRYGGGTSSFMSGHFCGEAQMTALAQIMRGFLEINQKQMINAGLDICATFYNLIAVGTYCIDYYNRSDKIDFTNNEKATEKLIPGPDYPWYLILTHKFRF